MLIWLERKLKNKNLMKYESYMYGVFPFRPSMVWVKVSLAVHIELLIGGEMAKGEMGINRKLYHTSCIILTIQNGTYMVHNTD
jgi:hypothetical protein